MTMSPIRSIVLAALVLTFTGCDYVDLPKGDQEEVVPPGTDVPRKVLLEDCTGHTCNNCPEAALIAHELQGIYGENLVVVGIHMTSTFAAPVAPLGDGIYDTDFRTPAGNAYETAFSIPALPMGMVSRRPYNNNVRVGRFNWAAATSQIIGTPADLDIWFDTFNYNSSNNTVTATVKVAVMEDISTNLNLTVYLTEDHVIDWQTDNTATPPEVPDYEHRHVLRSALNGTWGEELVVGSALAGDTLEKTISYPLPANVLDPANCALVAYAYRLDSREVLQVEEHKFQP